MPTKLIHLCCQVANRLQRRQNTTDTTNSSKAITYGRQKISAALYLTTSWWSPITRALSMSSHRCQNVSPAVPTRNVWKACTSERHERRSFDDEVWLRRLWCVADDIKQLSSLSASVTHRLCFTSSSSPWPSICFLYVYCANKTYNVHRQLYDRLPEGQGVPV